MTTQVTKVFKLGGTVGVDCDYNTDAARRAYVAALTCVASDINVTIQCATDVTLSTTEGPATYDATRYVTYVPAAGLGVNDLNRSTFDIGATGIAINVPRSAGASCNALGVSFKGFRVLITGTATNAALLLNQDFAYNKIYDTSTGVSTSEGVIKMSGGRVFRNLGVMAGAAGNVLFYDGGYVMSYFNNTWQARGAAANAGVPIKAEYGAGSTVINDVFINCGNTLLLTGNNLVASNCYSNTTPTIGRTTGITVVSAAGGLVVNETSDFTPSAAGGLIGTATGIADGTNDILGNNSGSDPDVGAWERDPVAASATAVITGVNVTGTTVVVSGTTANTPTSGTVTLTPTAAPYNSAVAQGPTAVTLGSGTFTITFTNVPVGAYSVAGVATNGGGSNAMTGLNTANVTGATGAVTSHTLNGQILTISGTTTGAPTSGTYIIPVAAVAPGGAVQQSGALTLGSGTFTMSVTLVPGSYDYGILRFVTAAGTSLPIAGTSGVTINELDGNPELPPPSSNPTYRRAMVLVAGILTELATVNVGTGKTPVVYVSGRLRQRVASEGTPVVKINNRLRLLPAGDTLEV